MKNAIWDFVFAHAYPVVDTSLCYMVKDFTGLQLLTDMEPQWFKMHETMRLIKLYDTHQDIKLTLVFVSQNVAILFMHVIIIINTTEICSWTNICTCLWSTSINCWWLLPLQKCGSLFNKIFHANSCKLMSKTKTFLKIFWVLKICIFWVYPKSFEKNFRMLQKWNLSWRSYKKFWCLKL